jgi:uncharacterized protein
MSVELRPLGVRCNLGCRYCYQQPQRDAGNTPAARYDVAAMKAAILAEGGPFTLFGGEPLLLPAAVLDELWAWGLEQFGGNSVQTNGTLITETHLDLFRRYRVRVGISADGPGQLNDARTDHTLARTRRATARTEAAIARLCAAGMPPSLIVTLHRGNAAPQHRAALHDWFRHLDRLGVTSVRLHLLEVDAPAVGERYLLDPADNLAVLGGLAELEAALPRLRFDLFTEMRQLLTGDDRQASCVWRACDPYTTPAVRGVEGDGRRSNCGRTNKEGIDFVKAGGIGYERQIALYYTPQQAGGCQGCRFFLQCKGQCPGTAVDGDWRNRSAQCPEWFGLFERLEADLLAQGQFPLSRSPDRPALEEALLRAWKAGTNPPLAQLAGSQSGHPPSAGPSPAAQPAAVRPAAGERLPFRLPAFQRLMWTTELARNRWQPAIQDITRAVPGAVPGWLEATGRSVALITLAPWQVLALRTVLARRQLDVQVLPAMPATDAPGAPAPLFGTVAVGAGPAVLAARQLWDAGAAGELAAAAKIPACCASAAAADRVAGWHDRTWPGAARGATPPSPGAPGSAAAGAGPAALSLPVVPQTSTFMARLGLRAAQHQPCRAACPGSRRDGEAFLAALAACHPGAARQLTEILSWPLDWSARHGIAELRTPVFKLAYDTDATAGTLGVTVTSSHYPAEGATGLRFPYRAPARLLPLA